ncbi:succinyldiaminopimelate transaminase [Amycolatopsis sp. H20-H5]|uniref:succinyldiaminopimelate transaminase n=1 Tax=Amycolatopsis sp. H20-H5 TaxID=3046309 RepID=UPI002DBC6FE0|nr:succinyldiaminopimelate transaminase [Amycolatopsis sp. H20-H5]MEC3979062.1 succinyldiaminopimelate transaminase [Amycolatopsis sp. H20-H5]
MADQLFPEFPWNRLAPLWATAREHAAGPIDLSIGAPVDPTPRPVREALIRAVDAPGYPSTEGSSALRDAVVDYLARRGHVRCLDADMVLPTIGSKEAIAQLPAFLGFGSDDVIAIPDLGYPTYEIGALSVGATLTRYVDPLRVNTEGLAALWVNSPGNPEGRILDAAELELLVSRARATGTLLISDECYLEFGWDRPTISIMHPDVCGNDPTGLLIINSLSKRSNLAGYRAAFLAGDPTLVSRLLEYRKHMGQMVPLPVQAAMTAALNDDDHVTTQRERYLRRRHILKSAVEEAGFIVDHSEGGLYLWVRRDGEDCWQLASWFARRGVICVPGEIYGVSGRNHVRLTITTTDQNVSTAADRISSPLRTVHDDAVGGVASPARNAKYAHSTDGDVRDGAN